MEEKNDEIDLLELFRMMVNSVKKGIVWILNSFKFLLILLIKKSIWIIIIAAIGAGIGVSNYYSTDRYYSSEMQAKSNATPNDIVINSINLLSDLCSTGNYDMLASYLETSATNAQKVKSIQAYYGIDVNKDGSPDYIDYEEIYNPKDTNQIRLSSIFYIKVEVFDESVFSIVKEGTKKYLFGNPYIEENNKVRKQQTLDMINYYDLEIKKLDSLQKSYYFSGLTQQAQNNQMLFLNEKDVKLFHQDMLKLVREKQYLEKSLEVDPEPVTVIQDFTPLSKAENPMNKYLIKFGLAFALMGFVVSLLWEYRKSIFLMIKNNK